MDKRQSSLMARQLLEGGVAWRHVKRFLRELSDHFDDLHQRCRAEGLSRPQCDEQAGKLLGEQKVLVKAFIEQKEMHSLGRRHPILLLACAPVMAYVLLFISSLFLFVGFAELFEPGKQKEAGAIFSGIMVSFCFVLMYLLSPLLAAWSLAYSIQNRLSLKLAVVGVMILTALSCAVKLHLQFPDVDAGIEGTLGVSLSYDFASGFDGMDSKIRLLLTWSVLALFAFMFKRQWQRALA